MSTSTRPAKGTSFTIESGSEWRVTSVRKAWDGQLHVYATPAFAYVEGGSNRALGNWTLDEWNTLHATPAAEPVQDEQPAAQLEDAAPHPHPCPCGCHLGPAPELTERCRQPLAGTGGEPCQGRAGHEGRGQDATGQPWSHAAPAGELDTEQAAERYGVCRWDGLPQRPGHWDLPNHRQLLERDHTDALAEDAAHDAATVQAMPLNAYLASLDLGMPRRLPQTLRTMAGAQRYLSLVPPGAQA